MRSEGASFSQIFRNIGGGFDDVISLFLPDLCLLCDDSLAKPDKYICEKCWASLTVFPDQSGQPVRSLRGLFDRIWIGWSYDSRMRQIIHLFKYQRRPEMADMIICQWIKTLAHPDYFKNFDLVLPVPIHSARFRWRGFNQSEKLARRLAQAFNLKMETENTVRVINTPSQTLLNREKRWDSVARAFQVHDESSIKNKRILIVDDLVTSGATLHSLAKTLQEHNAASVSAAVLTSPQLSN